VKFKAVGGVLLKTVLPTLAALAALIALIAWLAGVFHTKIQPAERPVAGDKLPAGAETYEVRPVEKAYFAEAVGTLKAASRTEISARIMAPINRVKVKAGDTVLPGDVLIELDSQALKTKLSQARASLAAADAAMMRAKDAYARGKRLQSREERVITAEKLNELISNYQVSKANQNLARQAVAEAEVMLSYTTITAPKAGMIVDRLAEVGDMAQPGKPLLVLYDPASLRLEVPVMESLAVNLAVGDELSVYIDARKTEVAAVVDEIVPQAEAASRSLLVKVRLPRLEGLFEGLAGRLKIPAGRRRHLCLHVDTIERIGQLEFVEVVTTDGSRQRRLIKTGRYGDADHIEVLSGLEAGEVVQLRPSGG